MEWDGEIVEDLPNQRIAWRSVGDADVQNAGAVASTAAGRPPTSRCRWSTTRLGVAGELVAELFKDPDKQVQQAVENFRMVVERGGLKPPPDRRAGYGLRPRC